MAEGMRLVQPVQEMALGETKQQPASIWGGETGIRKTKLAFHSGTWRKDKRQEASFEVREVLTGYKEDHLYHEDNWAVGVGSQDIFVSSSASGVFKIKT